MQVPTVSRSRKMPKDTWSIPFAVETVRELRRLHALCAPEIVRWARGVNTAQKYIKRLKIEDEPCAPLAELPVRAGVNMYAHQIKAFNIALALFGYPIGGE